MSRDWGGSMARRELTEEEIAAKVAAAKDIAVVRWVNAAIKDAIVSRASELRLNCRVSGPILEFKVGEIWSERPAPPKSAVEGVLSRLKIMAAIDFAGEGSPERGEFKLKVMESMVTISARHSFADDGEEITLGISKEGEVRQREA